MLQIEYNYMPNDYSLIFRKSELADDKESLIHYKVGDHNTINLLPKMKSGNYNLVCWYN